MESSRSLKIAVAHDAGPGGDDALQLALLIARPGDALIAAIVVPYPPGTLGDPPLELLEHAETWQRLSESRLQAGRRALAERAMPKLADYAARALVTLRDSAAAGLTELCDAERPDILTIGSSPRGGIGRLLLGSTGERVVHGASLPVGVAPVGFGRSPRSLRRIVVGFDGRDESVRGLELACELARRHSASLELVAVVEPHLTEREVATQAFDVLSGAGLRDRRAEELRRLADAVLTGRAQRATVTIEHGEPLERLLSAAEQGADLLVVGSRGHGPLARVLLGRVSAALVREAPCPVLLTPRVG